MFTEVKNIQLYDEVVSQVKEEIKKGNLKSGEKLPSEQEIAKMFNVSRSTIREALTILRVEGIVETKKGVGTIILGIDNESNRINENFFNYLVKKYDLKNNRKNLFQKALELVKLRKMLEPRIYEELAENCPKDLIKELKECLKATRKRMKEKMPYTVELTEFHYITYKYITNEMLREFMMLGFEIQRLHRDMSLYFEDSKELSVQEHEKLYEYIVEGKKEEAKALIESHLEKTERLLLEHIKELG